MIALFLVLALLALARVLELFVSRRNWNRHRDRAQRPKEPLFIAMVALHSSVFILLPLEAWFFDGRFGGALSLAALAALFPTLVLRVWTLKTLGASWNVRIVGGPNYPIIDDGPYRYIRHPNYVVVALELLLLPTMFHLWRSALLLSALNLLVLQRRITSEETLLGQNPAWVARMAHKPRFIPMIWKA